jgi:hypothetical protein
MAAATALTGDAASGPRAGRNRRTFCDRDAVHPRPRHDRSAAVPVGKVSGGRRRLPVEERGLGNRTDGRYPRGAPADSPPQPPKYVMHVFADSVYPPQTDDVGQPGPGLDGAVAAADRKQNLRYPTRQAPIRISRAHLPCVHRP